MKPTHRNIYQLRICLRCPTKWTGTCQTGAHDCLACAGHSALQQSLRANRGRYCWDLIYPSVQRPIMGRDWCCQMSHLRATLINTDEPKQWRLPTRTDVWWRGWSHEVHIWVDTLCPNFTAAAWLSTESNENANPAEVKSIKMSTTDHFQVSSDMYRKSKTRTCRATFQTDETNKKQQIKEK